MSIHATAIVDPGARLAGDVEVCPYACIGREVEIGPRTIVQSHAVLQGIVRIGSDNLIGHGAIIGTPPQDLAFTADHRSGVEIGDRNIIREHCTIHRGTAEGSMTRLGSGNFLMAGAHLGHNCSVGDNVIIANNCLLGGYVIVEDGAFLGGGCVFHQFMRVGQRVITQGNAGFSKDIPPFCVGAKRNEVFGLNVVGLRRAGLTAGQRKELRAAFRLLYQSGRNVTQALAAAEQQSWSPPAEAFFAFVRAAKRRGICAFHGTRDSESEKDPESAKV